MRGIRKQLETLLDEYVVKSAASPGPDQDATIARIIAIVRPSGIRELEALVAKWRERATTGYMPDSIAAAIFNECADNLEDELEILARGVSLDTERAGEAPTEPSEAAIEAAHDAMLMQQVETGGDEISLKQVLRAAYAADRVLRVVLASQASKEPEGR